MEAVFLKLLNMSISAVWVVAIVLLLRLILRKAPKWIHCLLWAMVALRLVCPFSIESAFSMLPSAEMLPSEVVRSGDIKIHTGFEQVDTHINSGVLESYMEGVTVPVGNTSRLMGILALVWIIGMALMAVYAAVSYFRLKRKVAVSVATENNVRICDYIDTPFILGIVHPVIYLPSSMPEHVAASVLAHEAAHIRRKDHWWKPLGYLLLSIHWFNPVLWLAYVLLCRDIEMACDEKVIREMDSAEKQRYSQALLACSMPRHLVAACPLAFGEVGVKERVKSVLNYKKPAFWLILIAIIVCIVTAVCFLTDPAANTIAKQFEIEKIDHFVILTGEQTVSLTNNENLEKFIKNAKIGELPISQSRSEDRPKDYGIALSAGGAVLYFDSDFSDVWMYDGVKPSLSYRLENPEQARSFFEEMLGIEIPEAVSGGPDENGLYYFTATVLRASDNSVLVEPLEGCWERQSSDKIWVSLKFQSDEPVPEIRVGDRIKISYNGMIAETYPAQADWVYDIEILKSVITDDVLDKITASLGVDTVTLFDYQNSGAYAVMGCRYGDKYGLAYLHADGSVRVLGQEALTGGESELGYLVDYSNAEMGTLAVLVTDPSIYCIYVGDPEWEHGDTREYQGYAIYNFPGLLLVPSDGIRSVVFCVDDTGMYRTIVSAAEK